MTTEMSFLSRLLDVTGIVRAKDPLTTHAKWRSGLVGGHVPAKDKAQPPPWREVEQLSIHLRQDIGLDRGRI